MVLTHVLHVEVLTQRYGKFAIYTCIHKHVVRISPLLISATKIMHDSIEYRQACHCPKAIDAQLGKNKTVPTSAPK